MVVPALANDGQLACRGHQGRGKSQAIMATCPYAVCSPCNSKCATACWFSAHLAKVCSLFGSECPIWQEYGSWRRQQSNRAAVGCTREANPGASPPPQPTMT